MKRLALAAVLMAALAGCTPAATPTRTAAGHVLVRAAVTQYQPVEGTPCEPASTIDVLTLTAGTARYQVPLAGGTVAYPDGKPAPGEQWCSIPFTVQVAPASDYDARLGDATATVPADKLYSADGATLMVVAGLLAVV